MRNIETIMVANQLKLDAIRAAAGISAANRIVRRLNRAVSKLQEKALADTTERKNDNVDSYIDKNLLQMHAVAYEYRKLRREARAIHLFRAFLNGRPYAEVEAKTNAHTQNAVALVYETEVCPSFDVLVEFQNWLNATYKPTEARVAKMAKAAEAEAAYIAARAEAAVKAKALAEQEHEARKAAKAARKETAARA